MGKVIGMTKEEYKAHIAEWGSTKKNGSPLNRYGEHMYNAMKRGVEWNISFKDWWDVWQQSGHWHERGNSAMDYCMGRVRDTGPYQAGNVYITTNTENCSKSLEWNPHMERGCPSVRPIEKIQGYSVYQRKKGTVYLAAWKRKHLGTFNTPEEARAAYIKARSADYPEAPTV